MPNSNPRAFLRFVRCGPLAVAWVCLTWLAASAEARDPFLTLTRTDVNESFYDGTTFVLGVIKEIKIVSDPPQPPVSANTQYEINLQLEVERRYCGPEAAEQEMTIRSIRYRPRLFLRDGLPSHPAPGDRIFFLRGPKGFSAEEKVWSDGSIGLVTPQEQERCDRVFEILASDDGAEAAMQLEEGCFSPDPQFAAWCLNLLFASHATVNRARPPLYALLRPATSRAELIALCWRVVQNDRTPCGAYQNADAKLAATRLSDDEIRLRHERHLLRLTAMIDGAWPDATDSEIVDELVYLIRYAYPKMPASQRVEAIAKLTDLAGPNSPPLVRKMTLLDIRYLAHEKVLDDELRQALFLFYQKLPPPDPVVDFFYFFGLQKMMKHDSDGSGRLCHEGLSLLAQALSARSEANADAAAQQLGYYCNSCQANKVEVEALAKIVQDLCDATPHVRARQRLTNALRTLGVKPKPRRDVETRPQS